MHSNVTLIVLSDGEKGPVLNYGNAAALKLWAASWEQLTSMPSSETAEPQERATRAAFMNQIKEKGFADNYSGKLVIAYFCVCMYVCMYVCSSMLRS